MKTRLCGHAALAAAMLAYGGPGLAQTVEDLKGLSIEELSQVEVTSASKRPEPLSSAAAALFVITNADIIRSGATSLPEALRIAPNLDVERVDARQYTVSARGFQGVETSNKLLVQIDGRSVYSTLADSVFWDLYQVPLEDIERVEVVSGPGGTLYGVNAVNGVINVTMRDSRDTQGLLARGTAGNLEQTGLLQYGGKIGGDGGFRVYVSGYNRDGFPAGTGGDLADGGEGVRGGFRTDLGSPDDHVVVEGDIFDNEDDNNGYDRGGNLLARWTHSAEDGSSTELQGFYSRYDREALLVHDRLEYYDISAQHNRTMGAHQIVFGGGVRVTHDLFDNDLNGFVLDPESNTLVIGNVFVQDRMDLGSGFALTGGLKAEKTTFTGVELLPNLRLAWQPNDHQLLWTAVSRAVRTPSRIDEQLVFPGLLTAGTFDSEKLTAIEAGYRGQPTHSTSLSVNVFYNLYDDLRSTSPAPGGGIPLHLANGIKGHTYGVEAWGSAQVTSWWRLSAGIATLHKDFHVKPGQVDLQNFISLGNDPDYQWQVRSRMDLTPTVGFDFAIRGVDSRPNPHVDAYVDADARLGWRVSPKVELFVAGTNLFHNVRDESADVSRGQLVHRLVSVGARFGL